MFNSQGCGDVAVACAVDVRSTLNLQFIHEVLIL